MTHVQHCSGCGRPHERKGQRKCRGCHAAYMRAWRVARRAYREQIVVAKLNGSFPCWIPARKAHQVEELKADICEANGRDWAWCSAYGWEIFPATLEVSGIAITSDQLSSLVAIKLDEREP